MGYEILEKVIELTDSSEALEKRFDSLAKSISESLSFDQCAIYLFDEERKIFSLSAADGDRNDLVHTYHDGEGLPWSAVKKNRPIIANISDVNDGKWRGVKDNGLLGFATAAVYPIKDDTGSYGMLYLKSRKKKIVPLRKRKLLSVISLQIGMAIKTNECILNLTSVNTKMRDMQARLVHAEKLLALGEMAATLAHEIKNPLMSIGGFAKRLSQQFTKDTPERMYVDMIVKESKRVEKLLHGILNFSTNKGFELKDENISSLIDDTLALFEDEFKRINIKIVKELKGNITVVKADAEQLRLVFTNLFTNAMQAMENGGILTVKTDCVEKWITAEVTDTGGGIEPSIIGNIFNPFFTTKAEGTGLGLAIAHTIVANHKGMIEVMNDIGKGVTFLVKLPAICKEIK